MELFLDRALNSVPSSDKDVVNAFIDYLARIKAEFYSVFQCFSSDEMELTENMYEALLRHISSCFHDLDELHIELSYIHGHWTPPEAFVFVKSLFAPLKQIATGKNKLSVVLSDTYMFEEFDLRQYLYGGTAKSLDPYSQTPTLLLPKLEFENPLQWGTMVHEMGHAFYEPSNSIFNEDEINEMSKGSTLAKKVINNWTEEIYCDLLSLHLLGPAYLVSFVEFITIIGSEGLLESFSDTHPPPRFRIVLMWQVIKNKGLESKLINPLNTKHIELADFYYELFEERCKAERKYFGPSIKTKGALSFDMNVFRNRIEERVEKIIPLDKKNSTFNIEKFKFLYKRLKKGVPIGAFSNDILNGNDEQYLTKLQEIDRIVNETPNVYNPDVEKLLETVFNRVSEEPCSTAEIINTGWLFKIEKIYKNLIDNIRDISPSNELNFKEDIRAMDALLKNSIETSFLTQLLR